MRRKPPLRPCLLFLIVAAALAASPAARAADEPPKHLAPIPAATAALIKAKGTTPAAPILVRVYKKEAELEVWKRGPAGRFVHLKTFPICRWSGQLGPKQKEGDRQAPEGFYAVTPALMNPNSAYYLSFDTGFPNAYDKARGATGSALMVHGTCSSRGCFAMTDEAMGEIYALAREAFAGGQKAFQLQAYPFRMSAENLVRHRADPHVAFWRQLKEGSDRFEATGEELRVGVTNGRYAFRPSPDPARETAAQALRALEEDHAAVLLEEGRPSIRTTYADGGQNPIFAALARRGVELGDVSRPEALAFAGKEIVLSPARPRPPACAEGGCRAPEPRPLREWPFAEALPTIETALPPLEDRSSPFAPPPVLASARIDPPAIVPGSLRILPAGFSRSAPTLAGL